MKLKKLTVLSLIGFGLVSTQVMADADGLYIGAGKGISTKFDDGGYIDDAKVTGNIDTADSAYSIYAGYYFNRVVGIEVSHTKYGDVNYKQAGQTTTVFSPTATSLSANLGFTFNNGLRPFALIGLSALNLDQQDVALLDNDSTAAIHWGAGLEYTPTFFQNLTMRAAYEQDYFVVDVNGFGQNSFTDDYVMGVGMVSLGAAVKF